MTMHETPHDRNRPNKGGDTVLHTAHLRSRVKEPKRSFSSFWKKRKVYVFDIDETLYPDMITVREKRRSKLYKHLLEMGHSMEECRRICASFQEKHGVAIKGFKKELEISDEVYKKLCVPDGASLDEVLPDAELRRILLELEGERVCLTNASREHAMMALTALNLLDCFEYVFHCDYSVPDFLCKPHPAVYKIVEDFLGIAEETHFFDDRVENVESARKHGWNVYLVTNESNVKHFLRKIHFSRGPCRRLA